MAGRLRARYLEQKCRSSGNVDFELSLTEVITHLGQSQVSFWRDLSAQSLWDERKIFQPPLNISWRNAVPSGPALWRKAKGTARVVQGLATTTGKGFCIAGLKGVLRGVCGESIS